MALAIAGTSQGSGESSGGVATLSVTRAAGESLVLGYLYEYTFGLPDAISSVVWDSAGDNQALTHVSTQQLFDGATGQFQTLAVYVLASPTSAKTANITVTHAGTNVNNYAFLCRRVTGGDTAGLVRGSAKRTESDIGTNDLPITISSATNDMVLAFGACRLETTFWSAGDTSDYVEQAAFYTSRCIFSGTKAGGASVTATFAYSDSPNYSNAIIAISLVPGGASAVVSKLALLGVG